MGVKQSRTRKQIREATGYYLNVMQLVTASATTDTTSLQDTNSLYPFSDNEINRRRIYCATPAGSIVTGEQSWVASFDSATSDATLSPAFSSAITSGDIFEMWDGITVEEVHNAIDDAINEVTAEALQLKQTETEATVKNLLRYDVLSGFVAVNRVEFDRGAKIDTQLESCDSVWTEYVDANVTATADSELYWEGSASLKLDVAVGAGTGIAASQAITSVDLNLYDAIEITCHTSLALDAGDYQVLLDDTALAASPLETLDIPAMIADKKYTHTMSLANPASDSNIISVAINMAVDKGALIFHVDNIRAVNKKSRDYRVLHPSYWDIDSAGSTTYLTLTSAGLTFIGANRMLKISGYRIPALMTADSDVSEVNPEWVVHEVCANLLLSHALSARLETEDRMRKAQFHQAMASKLRPGLRTSLAANTRFI